LNIFPALLAYMLHERLGSLNKRGVTGEACALSSHEFLTNLW